MRGTPVKIITGLDEPTGIAVTDDGLIIVSERDSHCITILDREGKKIRSIGTYGNGRGQLSYPEGVAVTSKGTRIPSQENGEYDKLHVTCTCTCSLCMVRT